MYTSIDRYIEALSSQFPQTDLKLSPSVNRPIYVHVFYIKQDLHRSVFQQWNLFTKSVELFLKAHFRSWVQNYYRNSRLLTFKVSASYRRNKRTNHTRVRSRRYLLRRGYPSFLFYFLATVFLVKSCHHSRASETPDSEIALSISLIDHVAECASINATHYSSVAQEFNARVHAHICVLSPKG